MLLRRKFKTVQKKNFIFQINQHQKKEKHKSFIWMDTNKSQKLGTVHYLWGWPGQGKNDRALGNFIYVTTGFGLIDRQ